MLDRGGNDVFSKVHEIVVETRNERLAVENINTHRGLEEFLVGGMPDLPKKLARNPERVDHGRILGFFHEARDAPLAVRGHDAESGHRLALDRDRSDREIRSGVDVLADHLAIIHPVKLVAAQDDEIFAAVLEKISQVLPHCIGCALIPPCPLGSLLGGENLNEAGSEVVEFVALVDMAVERSAVELGEDVNTA